MSAECALSRSLHGMWHTSVMFHVGRMFYIFFKVFGRFAPVGRQFKRAACVYIGKSGFMNGFCRVLCVYVSAGGAHACAHANANSYENENPSRNHGRNKNYRPILHIVHVKRVLRITWCISSAYIRGALGRDEAPERRRR